MLKKIEDIIPCIKEGNNKLMFYREGKLKTVKFKDLYKEIYFTALNIQIYQKIIILLFSLLMKK